MSEERENQEEKKSFEKHLYGVIYLDVLGQKELINKFAKNNASVDDERHLQKVLQHIKKLLDGLMKLKEQFVEENAEALYHQISNNCTSTNSSVLLSDVTVERVRNSLRETSFGIQQFSDSTLLYARLDGSDSCMAKVLLGLLVALLPGVMLEAFAKGIFFRGAITVGDAWELDDNNLYGSAIHEAYELEEKVAQWPRIVLSEKAVGFFTTDYKELIKVLPKHNLSRKATESLFVRGVDEVPQFDLVPSGIYRIMCLLNQKEEQEKFRQILINIKTKINEAILKVRQTFDACEINKAELSKLTMRYRILKRDLLSSASLFERTCHACDESEKGKEFIMPSWILDELNTDLTLFNLQKPLFEDVMLEEGKS